MIEARVRLSRSRGWRMPGDALKVDRTTPWGNPFRITPPINGSRWTIQHSTGVWFADSEREAQGLAVDLYAEWLLQPEQRPLRERMRLTFRRKRPACWCAPGLPCHATVILAIAATPLECEPVCDQPTPRPSASPAASRSSASP